MRGHLFRTIRISGLIAICCACSGLERSEREKVRKNNAKLEPIYRNRADRFAPIGKPLHTPRAPYPWETEAHLPRITKDFFRCKGNPLHPPHPATSEANPEPRLDCEGSSRHGLPIFRGKENVYPVLLELLNFIQQKTQRRVIVTCGHRCPTHNAYADASVENRSSKHQIGAEVDFYVQGMEDQPLEVVHLLMQYYQEHPNFKQVKEWSTFERYEKTPAKTTMAPWLNKEIFVTLYQKTEGRDEDNRHPYPYLSVQVRYDRDRGERVSFQWDAAAHNFPKGY